MKRLLGWASIAVVWIFAAIIGTGIAIEVVESAHHLGGKVAGVGGVGAFTFLIAFGFTAFLYDEMVK